MKIFRILFSFLFLLIPVIASAETVEVERLKEALSKVQGASEQQKDGVLNDFKGSRKVELKDIVGSLSVNNFSSKDALDVIRQLEEPKELGKSQILRYSCPADSRSQCIKNCDRAWHACWDACHDSSMNPDWPDTIDCGQGCYATRKVCNDSCWELCRL